MKVNGNLILVEGGVVENLTLPSGADFPANGSLGELFILSATELENMADGFYHHDGIAWRNLPTLAEVVALVNSIEVVEGQEPFTAFRPLLNARTMVQQSIAAGDYWVNDGLSLSVVGVGIGVGALPLFYYDPADYPVGTKFRLSVNINQNNAAGSGANTLTVGTCKVARPAGSGGSTNVVIYTPDGVDVMSVSLNAIPAKASYNSVSAEVSMPAEAGFYAFRINNSATSNASATHLDITLQAKY